jgi:hypothetical protein
MRQSFVRLPTDLRHSAHCDAVLMARLRDRVGVALASGFQGGQVVVIALPFGQEPSRLDDVLSTPSAWQVATRRGG